MAWFGPSSAAVRSIAGQSNVTLSAARSQCAAACCGAELGAAGSSWRGASISAPVPGSDVATSSDRAGTSSDATGAARARPRRRFGASAGASARFRSGVVVSRAGREGAGASLAASLRSPWLHQFGIVRRPGSAPRLPVAALGRLCCTGHVCFPKRCSPGLIRSKSRPGCSGNPVRCHQGAHQTGSNSPISHGVQSIDLRFCQPA